MPTLLVIVDFQNDFVSGSLAVPDAEAAIPAIIKAGNEVIASGGEVVVSRDWHPFNHDSFAEGEPTYVDGEWPSHCVQNTWGAEIHPAIREAFPDATVYSKGQTISQEQYSAYYATDDKGQRLSEYAHIVGFDMVAVVGLALDYCVRETTLDFWGAGYPTTVILDGTRPVTYVGGARTLLFLGHYDQGELHACTSGEVSYYAY